ncbi:pentatricopeptide repeat-containing protein At4g18520, chloroplastic [Jatropha curcas]|uniref:pentatricopeptide repeat-containing protein At4g18520, chloroplastic n=1 Tax=Jatropha curcas TaxID=180498 RepID=UPI0018950CE8|nr:pentatricopeptide repeat-containing protein At4g18520, chloroplastic [Jatropha curcas]
MKLRNNTHTNSASKFLSLRVNFVFSAAPVAATDIQTSPFLLQEVNRKIPRKFPRPKWSMNNQTETNYEMKRSAKEELKRYSGMLRECASKKTFVEGKAIHGNMIRSGLEPDSHLLVSLINFYVKCGSLVSARKVFDDMPEQDVVSWTALIAGCVSEGFGSDGASLYCEMRKENIMTNEFALATVLKACSMCLNIEFGKQVHVEAIKAGLLSSSCRSNKSMGCYLFCDLFVGSTLVDLYAKCDEVELADSVFFDMPEKNDVSWNALLNGYAQKGDGKEVLKLFIQMTECGMHFSKFTLSIVLKGCANSGNLQAGKILHSLAIRSGCELDEFLGCSLVDMYSKCGLAYDALKVFSRIKDPERP